MALESLHGRTALVTGAARRIGRAIALALAGEGMDVVLHYGSSGAAAEELRDRLADQGRRAWVVQADFAHDDAPAALIDRALAAAGSLDLLVSSASIFPADRLSTLTRERLAESVQINAWAPFALGREFHRRVGRGQIVHLLDTRIRGYDWNHSGYILSKHLLAVLIRMTAMEYAPDMRVNAVAPGLILPPAGQDASYLDRLASSVPLVRHGDPGDVAAAVVFLARSPFVTGQVLFVDGGRHLREGAAGEPHSD